MNEWIASRTELRIREAVGAEAFGARDALVLASALYFRARWKDEFDREATRPRPFWVGGVHRVKVPMMNSEGDYPFARRQRTLVVELPYLGGPFSMFILLPRERGGIAKTEEESPVPSGPGFVPDLRGRSLREAVVRLNAMGWRALDAGEGVVLESILRAAKDTLPSISILGRIDERW